jgi:hypothetical protein
VITLNFQDFRTSPVILAVALGIVAFVLAQSIFFLAKSWKKGKELGISVDTLKNTVVTSALFTVAPAISILATVLVLANALGLVLPWIRLTVIGNLAYETTAAQTALDFWGTTINSAVGDKQQFATIAWAMTLGSIAPLILVPFLCKKLQKTVGNAVNKNENSKKLGDAISAAAFIGIVFAFVAREINGYTATTITQAAADGSVEKIKMISGSSGAMSILVLISSMLLLVILEALFKALKLEKLQSFAMPLAMFGAMGIAILLTNVLPESIVSHGWYEIGTVIG